MIKLKEGQKVYGTDGKQYLIERGDMVKTLHINEGSNKLPYDVLIDGIVDQDTGFNVRQSEHVVQSGRLIEQYKIGYRYAYRLRKVLIPAAGFELIAE